MGYTKGKKTPVFGIYYWRYLTNNVQGNDALSANYPIHGQHDLNAFQNGDLGYLNRRDARLDISGKYTILSFVVHSNIRRYEHSGSSMLSTSV